MNKTQLIEKLKKPEDKINSMLKAAAISTDLKVYTDDHLKTLIAINEIVESGIAKTDKDAAELYHKQQESIDESKKADEANGCPNSTPSQAPNLLESKLDSFIQLQANSAADVTLASLPSMAQAEHDRLRALFVQRYRQRIAERLQDPEFRHSFQLAIEGQDMGKRNLLNGTTKNIALPSNSSSSS